MRKMADGGRRVIVQLVIENQRYGAERGHELPEIGNGLRVGLLRRRDNIVSVFQKKIFCARKTCFLGAGHRMSADKPALQTECADFSVDGTFDAAHIGDDAVLADIAGQLPQIFDVFEYRRTEKDIVAVIEIPDLTGGFVCDKPLPECLGHRFCMSRGGDHGELRVNGFEAFGDGAADKAKPDKAYAAASARAGTRSIILAHLSRENNTPQMALNAVGRLLEAAGWDGALSVAERDRLSEAFLLERVSSGG